MIRPADESKAKQPFSVHESRPIEYDREGVDDRAWRWSWDVPCVWGSYEQALSYFDRHRSEVDGLSFVLHPAGEFCKKPRIICLDFDDAIGPDGEVDLEVLKLLEIMGTYVEFSRSGRGLHAFFIVDCEPFVNRIGIEIGDCLADLLCSSQVAVTGEIFADYDCEPVEVDLEKLASLIGIEVKYKQDADAFDWDHAAYPSSSVSGDTVDQLRHELSNWEACIEGQNGDRPFFAAACHIMRHGITGELADELLSLVPQDPPFTAKERAHRLKCAYAHTCLDDTFSTMGVENEFEPIPNVVPEFSDNPDQTDRDKELIDKYGFRPVPFEELEEMNLELEYIVDGAFVENQPLFIGGREKCFKTGIAADLLMSLATGTKFLGRFDILKKKRSAFFTAEVGLAPAKALLKRIREAKGLNPEDIRGLDVIDSVPSFQINPKTGQAVDPKTINGLRRYFDDFRPEIAVFDPLYFAMGGAAVGDMYEIGGVLRSISNVCKMHGVWPIFCHHARKDSSKEFQPMDLADFYGSGVSAFARQWILMSHAERFEQGRANMYCRIGGSASGDRGLWRLKIEEGVPDAIIDRTWKVSICPEDEAGAGATSEQIEDVLRNADKPMSVRDIAFLVGEENSLIERILREMHQEGRVHMQDRKFRLLEATL